ncbi:MAG: aldehyde dehydrogenase family protein [Microbacterium sp.]
MGRRGIHLEGTRAGAPAPRRGAAVGAVRGARRDRRLRRHPRGSRGRPFADRRSEDGHGARRAHGRAHVAPDRDRPAAAVGLRDRGVARTRRDPRRGARRRGPRPAASHRFGWRRARPRRGQHHLDPLPRRAVRADGVGSRRDPQGEPHPGRARARLRARLAPLIEPGFLRIVTGGGDVGAYLTRHPDIAHVHITGSEATFRAIVPGLSVPITAELGGVSPIIIVPGEWSRADLRYQAEHVVTMRLHNSGHNCIAGQVVILSRDWPQRAEFLDELRAAHDRAPRPAGLVPEQFGEAGCRTHGLPGGRQLRRRHPPADRGHPRTVRRPSRSRRPSTSRRCSAWSRCRARDRSSSTAPSPTRMTASPAPSARTS